MSVIKVNARKRFIVNFKSKIMDMLLMLRDPYSTIVAGASALGLLYPTEMYRAWEVKY